MCIDRPHHLNTSNHHLELENVELAIERVAASLPKRADFLLGALAGAWAAWATHIEQGHPVTVTSLQQILLYVHAKPARVWPSTRLAPREDLSMVVHTLSTMALTLKLLERDI